MATQSVPDGPSARHISLFAILIGLACVALFNEFVLTYLFSLDLYLDPWKKSVIRIVDAAVIGASLAFTWYAPLMRRGFGALFRRAPVVMSCGLGLAIGIGVVAVVELAFHAGNIIRARNHPDPTRTQTPPIWDWPVVSHARAVLGDEVIYDVTYTMDEHGSRATPASSQASTGRDLVFFGCSFTFGEGVEDDQTLPNQVALRAPGWRVTNYGLPGQGPAHVLQRIEQPETIARFTGSEARAVYVFLTYHVERAIGTMRLTANWAGDFPCYVLTEDGALEYRGTMTSARPRLSRAYAWLVKEPMMAYFGADLPPWITDRHLELTARLIRASRERWLAGIENASFTVVIYPAQPYDRFPPRRMIPFFEANGIPYLDYSDRFDGVTNVSIPEEGHPNAKAYGLVADWLVKDLALLPADRE